MAFFPQAHSKPLVIQGNFQGCRPAFAAQARPAAQQPRVPKHTTAQRQGGPQPLPAQPSRIGNAFRVPPTVNLSNPGQGRPLPEAVRQQMESFFQTDFSDVRVHVGGQANAIGAVAFTLGSDLYFAPGQYNPNTSHGQQLLGHELTHVVQQRAGRVRNPFGSGVAVVQDPGMEAEAERMSIQAAAHRVPVQAKMAAQQKPGAAQQRPNPTHGGRPLAAHVQAAVAQAKTAQPQARARPLTTGGKSEVIQGKFPGGFSQIVQFHQQVGAIQPKRTGSAIQLAPSLTPMRPVSSGVPLPVSVQRKMENLFGTSFGEVRIHEGSEAGSIGARAFTRGSHIYFAPGQYNPTTPQGQLLLGHELAHVVQQRSGRVRNPFGSGVAVVQDPGLAAEAVQMSRRVMPQQVQGNRAKVTGYRTPLAIQPYRVLGPNKILKKMPADRPWFGYPYAVLDIDVRFPAQEKGANTFLATSGAANLNVLRAEDTVRLRLSDDCNMAIEDSNLKNRQPKVFFASRAVVDASNHALTAAGSRVRLDIGDHAITILTGRTGSIWLFRVKPIFLSLAPQNCNAMAAEVMGKNAEEVSRLESGLDMAKKIAPKEAEDYKKAFHHRSQPDLAPWESAIAYEYAVKRLDKAKIFRDEQVNEYAKPAVGSAFYVSTLGGNEAVKGAPKALVKDWESDELRTLGWAFHFAGVVAVSGTDRITLENYARGDNVANNADPRWYFQMYGEKQGQTFYDVQQASKGFSNPIVVAV